MNEMDAAVARVIVQAVQVVDLGTEGDLSLAIGYLRHAVNEWRQLAGGGDLPMKFEDALIADVLAAPSAPLAERADSSQAVPILVEAVVEAKLRVKLLEATLRGHGIDVPPQDD